MSVIHELSSVAPLAEFDLFGVVPTQTTVETDLITEHRPLSMLSPLTNIEFEIHSAIDEYIRLDETELKLEFRILLEKTGVKEDDWKKVSTANYLLHSLFKQIDLFIGNKQVTISGHTYAYRAEIETRLGASKEAKNSYLTCAMWFKDESESGLSSTRSNLIKPLPAQFDKSKGRTVQLFGKLHLDMSFQQRVLIGGTSIFLRLVPNDQSFYLISSDEELKPKIEFLDCCLLVHRSKVSRPIVEAHNHALQIAPAKYPIKRVEVKPFVVPPDTLDALIDNVHNGALPRRIFVALVSNESFNGSLKTNPFNYEHFNVNHIVAYLDGVQYPVKAFTPDFANELFTREYFSLFESTNQNNNECCIDLKRSDYSKGNVIYGFNFSPDLSSGCGTSGHVSPIRKGSLRLHIRFAQKLAKTINVLVYCEFDSIIEINAERNAVFNF